MIFLIGPSALHPPPPQPFREMHSHNFPRVHKSNFPLLFLFHAKVSRPTVISPSAISGGDLVFRIKGTDRPRRRRRRPIGGLNYSFVITTAADPSHVRGRVVGVTLLPSLIVQQYKRGDDLWFCSQIAKKRRWRGGGGGKGGSAFYVNSWKGRKAVFCSRRLRFLLLLLVFPSLLPSPLSAPSPLLWKMELVPRASRRYCRKKNTMGSRMLSSAPLKKQKKKAALFSALPGNICRAVRL